MYEESLFTFKTNIYIYIYCAWVHAISSTHKYIYITQRIFLIFRIIYSGSSMGPVAQSVQQLVTGWAVRRSNPGGGEIFRNRPDRPWGPPILLYNGYRVVPGGKAAGTWR